MHYSRHTLTASVPTELRSCTRQPMTNGLALFVPGSVRQKLNRVSSVQFRYVALYALYVRQVAAVVGTRAADVRWLRSRCLSYKTAWCSTCVGSTVHHTTGFHCTTRSMSSSLTAARILPSEKSKLLSTARIQSDLIPGIQCLLRSTRTPTRKAAGIQYWPLGQWCELLTQGQLSSPETTYEPPTTTATTSRYQS